MKNIQDTWHHSPPHVFKPDANYMITSGTYHKENIFNSPAKLKMLENIILDSLNDFSWTPIAWAVMSNHYHLIVRAPAEKEITISKICKTIHGKSSVQLNKVDNVSGRKVWFEFWDTCLTYENSYYARLKYVMNNPVHHGIVKTAEDYEFCSAGFFKFNADKQIRKRLESYSTEKLNINDNF
ncbi:MAG: hypothetical protein A2X45_17490 [Lentisphaerae bacterium GWF2_50_93]|nr:MAG: hypothetical protein A2X45_17490 [Lentisphaerae bacterium GWF2_50_93]